MKDPKSHLEKAVREALAYSAVFNYPLSFYQTSYFLIKPPVFTCEDLQNTLNLPSCAKKKKGKYYLSGMVPVNWQTRYEHSKKLFRKKLTCLFNLMAKIPWISLIAVTGSLASFNSLESDDVDVLIVTQKKRLWISRLFLVLMLKILNKYRTDQDPSGKICPNIMLTEDALTWPAEKQNLFVAHEIVSMHPVFDRDNTYFKFIKANKWIFDYFGNVYIESPGEFIEINRDFSRLIDILEMVLRRLQLRHMKDKVTSEIATDKLIHFKRSDNAQGILSRFESLTARIPQ